MKSEEKFLSSVFLEDARLAILKEYLDKEEGEVLREIIEKRAKLLGKRFSLQMDPERPLLVLGIGYGGYSGFKVIRNHLEENLDIQVRELKQGKMDESGYRDIDTSAKDINPDGRYIVFFDSTVRSGTSMLSALKWAIENREDLNTKKIFTMSFIDYIGIVNFSVFPRYRKRYDPIKQARRLAEWEKDPKIQKKLWEHYRTLYDNKDIIVNRVYKMHYDNTDDHTCLKFIEELEPEPPIPLSYRPNPNWRQQWRQSVKVLGEHYSKQTQDSKIKDFTEDILSDPIVEPLLEFIDGYPATFFLMPPPTGGFLAKLSYALLSIGVDVETSMINTVGEHSHRMEVEGFISPGIINKRKVLVFGHTPNYDKFLPLAQKFTDSDYQNHLGFRFVNTEPFHMYTIDELFLESYRRGLKFDPADMGENVERYTDSEIKNIEKRVNLDSYRRDVHVVATPETRLYGIGLALGIGVEPSRYHEVETGEDIEINGFPYFVDMDRVRKLIT